MLTLVWSDELFVQLSLNVKRLERHSFKGWLVDKTKFCKLPPGSMNDFGTPPRPVHPINLGINLLYMHLY